MCVCGGGGGGGGDACRRVGCQRKSEDDGEGSGREGEYGMEQE